MSTEKIYQAVFRLANTAHLKNPLNTHLDIGAGSGRLIELFNEHFGVQSHACDYTPTLMELNGQTVETVDLNSEKLPYQDDSFDIVTATELIEHMENYRELITEIYRVLKPGGICILSTPNVLTINSRLRYLWFGFPDLFGPLPVGNRMLHSATGHITPVPYFYLAHALLESGFSSVSLSFDRYQRSGIAKLIFFLLPVKMLGTFALKKEISKYHTMDEKNFRLVKATNSVGMLLGRTIIVSAKKENM